MGNNIAIDGNEEVVHSSKIYNLRNKDRRVDARDEDSVLS